jgi:hypothetical protein
MIKEVSEGTYIRAKMWNEKRIGLFEGFEGSKKFAYLYKNQWFIDFKLDTGWLCFKFDNEHEICDIARFMEEDMLDEYKKHIKLHNRKQNLKELLGETTV